MELPRNLPVELTHHARRRGKTRCGINRDGLIDAVLSGEVLQREGGVFYVSVAGRKGRGRAVVMIQSIALVVVSVIPQDVRRRSRQRAQR